MLRLFPFAVICILASATVARAADQESQPQSQLDLELLNNIFHRALPASQVKAVAGEGGAIVLRGHVAHCEDVETVLGIARTFCGPQGGEIINRLAVGSIHVRTDLVLVRVDRSALERVDAELYRAYEYWFGTLRTANETERQQCLSLLEMIPAAGKGKLLTTAELTLSGMLASYGPGGQSRVPCVACLSDYFANARTQLNLVATVLEDGKVDLSIAADIKTLDDPSVEVNGMIGCRRSCFYRSTTSIALETGQTVVLRMPEAWENQDRPADDVVLVAMVRIVEPETTADEGPEKLPTLPRSPDGP